MARVPRRRRSFRRAWGHFERLESRQLLAVASLDAHDDSHPHLDDDGIVMDDGTVMMVCFDEPAPDGEAALTLDGTSSSAATASAAALAPLDQTFFLHSNPTATKVIYIDFDGHTTSNTSWRNGSTFYNEAYSLDADFATFSDAERRNIQTIWARVAEDYAPFNVDVTTEEPPLEDLRKSGAGDTRWGIRVVVGGDWGSAAGIALVGTFDASSDTPAFVFAGKWWKSNLNFVANAVSHEAGHTLGLGHDGYNGHSYYAGRGSGETSWGPIMGNPSAVNLTQWSKGEYGLATNKQDDLAIITTGNGFGYRADDHGDTVQTATVAATTGQVTFSGIIGGSTDVDVFRFTTLTGSIEATIDPIAVGTNLDILATLLDSNGNVVATSNPVDKVAASFSTKVTAGTYYITVRGTGMGDINTTGYTAYGSLGQYTVTVDTGALPTLSVADVTMTEGHSGTASVTMRVTLSAAPTQTVTVAYATADDSATTADNDYVATSGTLTWAVGDPRTKTFVVTVNRDRNAEANEQFLVRLSSPQNATIARGEATVTILDDDSPALMGAIGPLDALSTTYGTASDTSTMTVSGTNLQGDITATAPAGFEVSSDGVTFGPTATFTPTNNVVDGTLFIRLAATAEVGTYSGNVTLSATGLPDATEAVPESTVSPKELTITGLSVASRSYDGTTVATLSGTATLAGKVAGDSVALQGTAVGTFNSKDVATASTVAVSGLTLRGTKAANYTLTLPSLSASILPRPLTVAANNAVRVYGANNPALSATVRGFVAGESAATEVTGKATATTTATRTSNVGTYAITPAVGTLAATNGNYAFSFVAGMLTVQKATLSIKIDDKTKVAGQPDPAFTFMTLGLANGDTAATVVTGLPTRSAGEAVGSYAITRGTLALSAAGAVNYTLSPGFGVASGSLRIVAAAKPLSVTGAFVKGSNWVQNYLALPVFKTGPEGTALGFALGDGTSQLANQFLVTWSNVNRISLRFSEPINAPAADSLSLLAVTGAGAGTQTTVTSTAVALSEGDTVATWTLPAAGLVFGRYTLVLPAAAIARRSDGGQLDGEWTTGSSTFAEGSGNGTAGGDFRYQFQVLPGDVNASGAVLSTDLAGILRDFNSSVTTASYRSDVNGSGTIVSTDADFVRLRLGNVLPTGGFAPAVTAASGATVDGPFALSFADDAAWRAAITGIKAGPTATTLDPALATQLQTSGTVTILISATGYATVSVSQSLGVGAAAKLGIATQPAGPTANGGSLATQPTVLIQDKFGNTVTTSTAQVTAAVESGTGAWTLGGTLLKAAVAGLVTFTNLTATGSGGPVSGARIRFTAGGLTLVVSNTFTIP